MLHIYLQATKSDIGMKGDNETEAKPTSAKARTRLNSLDVFRGITICIMIFVNDAAGGYWFFEHTTWNGLQLADVVFPW